MIEIFIRSLLPTVLNLLDKIEIKSLDAKIKLSSGKEIPVDVNYLKKTLKEYGAADLAGKIISK